MFEITEKFISENSGDRPGKLKSFKGICIHDTGNPNKKAGARAHAKLETENIIATENGLSYQYVVDDTECYRLMPEDERAWHAGDGKKGMGNTSTIAIEICVNKDSDIKKATDRAVELTADILSRHNIKKAEVAKYLFRHHDFSKKDCPRQLRRGNPYSWKVFVENVIASMPN